MSGPGFIHLHVHSAYSLLEGALQLGKLLDCLRCRAASPARPTRGSAGVEGDLDQGRDDPTLRRGRSAQRPHMTFIATPATVSATR